MSSPRGFWGLLRSWWYCGKGFAGVPIARVNRLIGWMNDSKGKESKNSYDGGTRDSSRLLKEEKTPSKIPTQSHSLFLILANIQKRNSLKTGGRRWGDTSGMDTHIMVF